MAEAKELFLLAQVRDEPVAEAGALLEVSRPSVVLPVEVRDALVKAAEAGLALRDSLSAPAPATFSAVMRLQDAMGIFRDV